MAKQLRISPLRLPVEFNGEQKLLYQIEIRDLSRAFCGALFLALPLHYTMEMWARARVIPAWMMLIIIVTAYLLNVGYCHYSNFKGKPSRMSPWFDALESMAIGFVASLVTLLLIDQLTPQMPVGLVISCVALEMVPTSFGASLAKSQLAASNLDNDLTEHWSQDAKKSIAALLGGVMFAFNVGATQEPIVIATAIKSHQLIGIVAFSLFVSYLMIFMTGFSNDHKDDNTIMGPEWAETVVCYAISLIVSAALLWMFGYLDTSTPHDLAIPWIVVLGYATTLGGSAGRLVI